MASVRRNPRNGRWEVRYRDATGAQRTQRPEGSQKSDALALKAAIETELNRGQWRDPALARTLLSEWIEEWWATTVNLRASSRARDESYIRNHLLPRFGPVQLGRITQLDVRAWVAELDARGLAPATVQKAYQTLGKIMEAAVDGGLIPASPCHKVPLPKIETVEMRFLSPDEIGRLAGSIAPRYRAFVLLKAYGGLRLSEMAGLRRGRVDTLRSTVRVAEQIVEVRGHMHSGPPKTKAGRRTVPLPRQVVQELVEHLARYSEEGDAGLVFPGPAGGPLRAGSWRQRVWRPAVDSAGLAPLRPHDLRHTAVSLWAAAGASPNEVAARAGHTSVSVVLDRYRHLFPAEIERTTGRLEAMFAAVEHLPDADVFSIRKDAV
jgi:integrase